MTRLHAIVRIAAAALLCAGAFGCASYRATTIQAVGQAMHGPGTPPPPCPPPGYQPGRFYLEEPGVAWAWTPTSIRLSPAVVVQPVGSEIVLLAGVCGPEGRLLISERVDWTVAAGSVGHFVDVGRSGWLDLLGGDFNRPRRIDATSAVGSTSRPYLRLTRGTPNPADDVFVLSGQAWATVSSPVEGTTHVTAVAPNIPDWNNRLASATIHWVDAEWQFPSPGITPAGSTHRLSTGVFRQSNQEPRPGWRVRYSIVDGPPAGFAPDGAQVAEVETDAAGTASVELFQSQPASGTNTVRIEVLYAVAGSAPQPVAGSSATVTWTAPGLDVRKTGPAAAATGSAVAYRIDVTNPGDLPTADVTVADEIPPGWSYVSSEPPGEPSGTQIRWTLGTLAPHETRTLLVNLTAGGEGSVTSCVEVSAAGGLSAKGCATTSVGTTPPPQTPQVEVITSGPERATVGGTATFQIDVVNRGATAAANLILYDAFDAGLQFEQPSPIQKEIPLLRPGESLRTSITFRVVQPGQLCHRAEARLGTTVLGQAQACVTAVESPATQPPAQPPATPPPAATPPAEQPPPVTSQPVQPPATPPVEQPQVSVEKTGPELAQQGELIRMRIQVVNTGTQALTGLVVEDRYDSALSAQKATEGHQFRKEGQYEIFYWQVPLLRPGDQQTFDVEALCQQASPQVCSEASVRTREGAQAKDEHCLTVQPAPQAPAQPPPETPPPAAQPPAAQPPVAEPTTPPVTADGLSLAVSENYDPVRVPGNVIYLVQVTNTSSAPVEQLALSIDIPPGMSLDPIGTGPDYDQIQRSRALFKPLPLLPAGQSQVYRVRMKTRSPGSVVLRAQITAPSLSQPLVAEESTEILP